MSEESRIAGGAQPQEAFYAALLEDDAEELYEAAPCAYVSALPDGTIAKVNQTFLSWSGYSRKELIGVLRLQDLLPPGDRIFYETHLAPLLRMQGHVREVALEIVSSSGVRLPVLLNSAMKTVDGAPVMMRVAIFDATERRSYEAELLAARRRAEESEARATTLARTLQESFLPPTTLSIPGLELGGAYRPAGDGSEVGGDFYDVFETGRGGWAVVLGDVCGKGAAAAVLTSLARYTVRAEAVRVAHPSGVLEGLHDAVTRYRPDEFCTALCMLIDPDPDGLVATVASGGHHLPVRRDATGAFETLGEPGTILGIVERPMLTDVVVPLRAGDLVVLYTDGVTEARRHDGALFDDDRLHATIDDAADAGAQDVADRIVRAALDFQGGDARDDIAVVVIKVPS